MPLIHSCVNVFISEWFKYISASTSKNICLLQNVIWSIEEESETGDNWDAPTITDADLDYAKAILQQHHVSVIDMGIAVGGDVYNDESKEKKALEKRIEEL